MAKSSYLTGNALTRKAWDEKLFRDQAKEAFFSPYMGKGKDSLIQVKTDLEGEKGDKITFGLRMRLTGAGQTGSAALEGNEEALSTYDNSITLEQYRHAVRDDGELSRKRTAFDLEEEMQMALKDWGSEKIDQLIFDAIFTTPTKVLYLDGAAGALSGGSAATATSALTAANSKISLDLISAAAQWAKTGGARAYVPLRQFDVGGGEKALMCLIHPDVKYDLMVSTDWKQANREAQVRGASNPLFKGAVAYWSGVIIKEHENVPVAANGGAGSVAYAKCALLGAQAGLWAWGRRPKRVRKTFDYDHEVGMAWSVIAKAGKPQFNSLDYGSIGLYVARTAVSSL